MASLLALAGWFAMTLALWQKKNKLQTARKFGVAQALLWLSYNLAVASIFGVATETISLISTTIALWRFAKHRKKSAKS